LKQKVKKLGATNKNLFASLENESSFLLDFLGTVGGFFSKF
jgi:hypothetical protein